MVEDEFSKRYRLIASTLLGLAIIPPIKKCRFCGLSEPDTTFHKVAHLISELLGKNNTRAYDECDKCNELFSKYESHLSRFFLPNLTMVGIRGKHRVPTFQSRIDLDNEDTRTLISYNPATHSRQVIINKQNDFVINHENKTGTITFRKPNYIPIYIYKALVKYGLSLMPVSRVTNYNKAIAWLTRDEGIAVFPSVIYRTLTNKKFERPYAELFEILPNVREEGYYIPPHILILGFANLILQVTLPVSDSIDVVDLGDKTAQVAIYSKLNSNELAGNISGYDTLDFSSQEKTNGDHKMFIKFDSYNKNVSEDDV